MSEDQKPFFIPEQSLSPDERLAVATKTVTGLMNVLTDNRIPENMDAGAAGETLWRHFTPGDYAAGHASEFGKSSPRLMEARAIIAFLEGNVVDGLFLCTALVQAKRDMLLDSDAIRSPW